VTHRGGDVMILAAFRDLDALGAARAHACVTRVLHHAIDRHVGHVESVRYRQGPVILQEPGLNNGIQRTLLVRVEPNDPATVERFEHDLADMTRYIPAIRNSSLSRVDEVHHAAGPVWTHVWEQEFRTLDGLTGPYMEHAYHWSFVDAWFDPQSPTRVVDTTLIHAACPLRESILARCT
jgi:hypothetical protein